MNASLVWGCFWLARTPSSSQSALSVERVKEACAVSSLISISQWHGSERSCSVPAWTLSALYGPVWWSGPDPQRTGHLWTDAALALACGGAVSLLICADHTELQSRLLSEHTVKLPFQQINMRTPSELQILPHVQGLWRHHRLMNFWSVERKLQQI